MTPEEQLKDDAERFLSAFRDKLAANEATNFVRSSHDPFLEYRGASFDSSLKQPTKDEDEEPKLIGQEVEPECPCPEGLSSIYCVDTPGGIIAIGLVGECHWCGKELEEDSTGYELHKFYDEDLEACVWQVTSPTDFFTKEWDDGDPEGVYTRSDLGATITVTACAGTVIPC